MSNDEGKFVIVAGHTRLQFGVTEEARQPPQQTAYRGEPGQNYNRQSHQEIIRSMHGDGILGTATDAKANADAPFKSHGTKSKRIGSKPR